VEQDYYLLSNEQASEEDIFKVTSKDGFKLAYQFYKRRSRADGYQVLGLDPTIATIKPHLEVWRKDGTFEKTLLNTRNCTAEDFNQDLDEFIEIAESSNNNDKPKLGFFGINGFNQFEDRMNDFFCIDET
jgi:hypothetical protein